MKLVHVDTGKFLFSSASYRYQHPIAGQQEISASARGGRESEWSADEGVYFAPRRRRS